MGPAGVEAWAAKRQQRCCDRSYHGATGTCKGEGTMCGITNALNEVSCEASRTAPPGSAHTPYPPPHTAGSQHPVQRRKVNITAPLGSAGSHDLPNSWPSAAPASPRWTVCKLPSALGSRLPSQQVFRHLELSSVYCTRGDLPPTTNSSCFIKIRFANGSLEACLNNINGPTISTEADP